MIEEIKKRLEKVKLIADDEVIEKIAKKIVEVSSEKGVLAVHDMSHYFFKQLALKEGAKKIPITNGEEEE